MHHRPRHTAKQELFDRAVAAGSHDEQIGVPAGRRFQQADRG
jgi:hypothetical protein